MIQKGSKHTQEQLMLLCCKPVTNWKLLQRENRFMHISAKLDLSQTSFFAALLSACIPSAWVLQRWWRCLTKYAAKRHCLMECCHCTVCREWIFYGSFGALCTNATRRFLAKQDHMHQHSHCMLRQCHSSWERKASSCLHSHKQIWSRCQCQECSYQHVQQVWQHCRCTPSLWQNAYQRCSLIQCCSLCRSQAWNEGVGHLLAITRTWHSTRQS